MAQRMKKSKVVHSLKSTAYITNWNNTDFHEYVEKKVGVTLSPGNMRKLLDCVFGVQPTVFNRDGIIKKATELAETQGFTVTTIEG